MKLDKATVLEILRFGLVGGVSFVVDFGFLMFFQEVCGWKSIHNGVLLSTALAYMLSLAAHYFMSVFWVFRGHAVKSGRDHAVAGSLFVVCYAIGFALTELGMWVGVTLLAFNYLLVKMVVTGIVMVWNYCGQKLFVFRNRTAATENVV